MRRLSPKPSLYIVAGRRQAERATCTWRTFVQGSARPTARYGRAAAVDHAIYGVRCKRVKAARKRRPQLDPRGPGSRRGTRADGKLPRVRAPRGPPLTWGPWCQQLIEGHRRDRGCSGRDRQRLAWGDRVRGHWDRAPRWMGPDVSATPRGVQRISSCLSS